MHKVLTDYPLDKLNTFGLKVRAALFACPSNIEELCSLTGDQQIEGTPMLVLGEGSNTLLLTDFNGLVLQPGMKGIERVEEDGPQVVVRVGAAENWDGWVHEACGRGWYGLENLSLIPGSVGSAPVQNIGAYGSELKDHFAWLDAWDLHQHNLVRLNPDQCRFGYRDSIFKSGEMGRYIITHVAFRLSRLPILNLEYGMVKSLFVEAGGASPQDLRKVIVSIRRRKLPDPQEYGNAGSFFKNPIVDSTLFNCIRAEYQDIPNYQDLGNGVKIPAAWLIERAGWKGKRLGNVGTWPAQPLVIVNYGGATGQQILEFSEMIQKEVKIKFGICLEREVNVV
jgi:UDP-N-acetylmuramate dehydrogenase